MKLTFLRQGHVIFIGCNGRPFRQSRRVNSKVVRLAGGTGLIQGKSMISALSVRAFGVSWSLIPSVQCRCLVLSWSP